jgi:hypothetical protein
VPESDLKICIGMFRPEWSAIAVGKGLIMCNCRQVLHTVEATREHWQMGHFDTPVYKSVKGDAESAVNG